LKDESKMTVRIGANPIGWSNDDLRELGGHIPLETCLAEARAAGFAGMELGHKFPREAPALRRVLSGHGLDLVSGWYSSALMMRDAAAELAALEPHLALLEALGARVLVFAETTGAVHGDRSRPISSRPRLAADDWPRLGRRMTEVAEAVAARGLDLVYHHHMGTVVESAEDIHALMAATGPAVKLLLDTGHATFAGADPVALARRYRDRIGHVHCKDVRSGVMQRARDEDWSFLDAVVAGVFTVPGDGGIDFAAVLAELPGYAGWLVVEAEQDPEKAPPARYAKLGYDNLSGYARAAGLL
jgi:inosose dehydratase/3D-(3,5/4)-trihydroxycyclohexane-1,2-dione acylhydrolase (decyclizing)